MLSVLNVTAYVGVAMLTVILMLAKEKKKTFWSEMSVWSCLHTEQQSVIQINNNHLITKRMENITPLVCNLGKGKILKAIRTVARAVM